MRMARTNFFIVGAPKCGTTALYSYLSQHNQVYMPWIKEPHYFAKELEKSRVRPIDNLEEYLSLFEPCEPRHRAIGEASVFYLSSQTSIQNIYQFNKQAKIIIMVRNPIDMFTSLHSQLYFTLDENFRDAQKAWQAQMMRKKGDGIPKTCRIPNILQYRQSCSLGTLTERVLNIFPREQVKIILFDDFVNTTAKVYKEVLTFIGVSNDGRVKFPKINENKVTRFHFVATLYHDRGILQSLWRAVEKYRSKQGIRYDSILHPIYTMAHQFYMKLNTKTVKRFPLKPEFRNELSQVFLEDVKQLSEIVGRNLCYWLADPLK
jgi:hypothetical protein